MALMVMAAPASAAELTVVLTGATATAPVRAMVFNDAEAFSSRARPVAAMVLTPQDGRARVTLGELPPGAYAVAAFQDVNGNQQLDTNWLGIPTEPTGFSRANGSTASSPDFREAAVQVPAAGATVSIPLQ